MNLKNITEEEILKLHTLSEKDQFGFLHEHGLINIIWCELSRTNKYETLADCAFRMRAEVWKQPEIRSLFCECVDDIVDSSFESTGLSKPIHWIQAALLAMKRGEK